MNRKLWVVLLGLCAVPGEYTLAFVQEKLGTQEQKVTLAAKDSKTVDATFTAE
jgi:hypothetical protein